MLIVNALIGAVFLALNGLFEPSTPHLVILCVLLAGGFFRSLQFKSVNTLAYADIERERLSRATSFASMMQQLSVTIGVGALILHLTVAARGGDRLAAGDFMPAFAAASALVYVRLPPDAGAEISGRVPVIASRPGAEKT